MKYPAVVVLVLFLCLGGVVFYNTLNNPFEFDDYHHIVENPHIKNLSGIPSFFTDHTTFSSMTPDQGGQYRPLLMVTYALNYRIGELRPLLYHLVNLSFHIGSAFLIYLIAISMLEKSPIISLPFSFPALAAGLIFLVHPFNAEVVNYISARSSVMSGFFYLLTFYFWVKYRKVRSAEPGMWSYYIASLLAFAAGMLTKEIVITLPFVLWLYDLYFKNIPHPAPRTPLFLDWRTYIPYLPFVLLIGIPYLLILKLSFGGSVISHFKRDIRSQLLLEIPILVKYWKMFFWPAGLSIVHDVDYTFGVSLSTLFSGLLIILYTGIAILLFRRRELKWKVISFFMFWFFIVLLPTTIIPLNIPFQENRGYLAIVSFVILTGVLLKESARFRKKEILIVVIVITLGIYSAATIKRNSIWKDDVTLWADAVQKNPASSRAYSNLGIAY